MCMFISTAILNKLVIEQNLTDSALVFNYVPVKSFICLN